MMLVLVIKMSVPCCKPIVPLVKVLIDIESAGFVVLVIYSMSEVTHLLRSVFMKVYTLSEGFSSLHLSPSHH